MLMDADTCTKLPSINRFVQTYRSIYIYNKAAKPFHNDIVYTSYTYTYIPMYTYAQCTYCFTASHIYTYTSYILTDVNNTKTCRQTCIRMRTYKYYTQYTYRYVPIQTYTIHTRYILIYIQYTCM